MYSKDIIDFFGKTTWDDLPQEIQHQSKRCLLDALGAMLIGTKTPVYDIVCKYVKAQFGAGDIPFLLTEGASTTTGSAFVYGVAANAVDIDDGCRLAKGHPGAHVIPAVLLGAQAMEKCSGKELLTALVMGYEAAIRAAYIRHATHDTYHTSGSWGATGVATAISKLWNLDAETTFNALGTASYHAPIAPMMVGIETPCMGKDGIGWAVFVGMSSVELAKQGFTGPKPIFDQSPNAEWVTSLGKTYEIMHLFFKPYSACRWAQAGVDGVAKIMRENGLERADVAKIRIYTFAEAAALSCEHPKNTEYAQYNFAYPIAISAMYGEVNPLHMLPPYINDPEVHGFMDKIEIVVEEKYQQMFPAKTVADVEIEDSKGNKYRSGDLSPRWDLSNTLPTDEELENKFKGLMEQMFGAEKTQAMIDLIWKLDQCDDVRELLKIYNG